LRLVSAVHIIRPSSETSPCDHFIVAITGSFRLVSAVHFDEMHLLRHGLTRIIRITL